VFAELGIKTGIGRIVSSAYRMGIRTPISHNYAITLGGLRQGRHPARHAHAYETIQQGGLKITNRDSAPSTPAPWASTRCATATTT